MKKILEHSQLILLFICLCVSTIIVPNLSAQVIDALKSDTIFYDQNGNLLANPGDSIRYIVIIENTGSGTATTIVVPNGVDQNTTLNAASILTSPAASNDGVYSVTGNIAIMVDSINGLLPNDFDDCISCLTISGGGATNQGGFITINSDGSFIYDPPPGYTGMDTVLYSLTDGTPAPNCPTTNEAIVTFNISNMIWFVNNNSPGSSNLGTFMNPFTSIASFNGATGPSMGDFISLATGTGTYMEGDGMNLMNMQTLIGQGVQLSTFFTAELNSVLAYQAFAGSAGTRPNIVTTMATNHGVDLASGNTIRGINIGNTMGYGIFGGAVGSLTIDQVNVTGNGGAIKIATSGNFSNNVNFGILSSNMSSEDGICLNMVMGTLGVSSMMSSIAEPTRNVLRIINGSVNLTYPGTMTKTTNGPNNSGILIQSHSGIITMNGNVTLGTIFSRLTATAVNLTTNTGTYSFAGLDIATNNAIGFNGSGGGTLNITGTNNTINSLSQASLNLNMVEIGASNINFQSIDNSMATNAIVLNTTGTAGGLIITGTGANNSGGTLNDNVQAILLHTSNDVSLTDMNITNSDEDGIRGTSVINFFFISSNITNFGTNATITQPGGDPPGSVSENGMDFVGLTGTVIIQNSTIGPDNNFVLSPIPPLPENDGIQVRNLDNSLLTMTVTGTTFTMVSNDGIDVEGQNSDVTLDVDGSTMDGANSFTQINGRSVTLQDISDVANNSTFILDINNNTFNQVGIGGRWSISGGSTVTANFIGNTMMSTSNDAVRSLINPGALGFTSSLNATITGNSMGSGGLFLASRRQGVSNVVMNGNMGIGGSHSDPVFVESSRGATMNIDIIGNTMVADANGPEFSFATLTLQCSDLMTAGTNICANISGNTITLLNGAANFLDPIWIDNTGTSVTIEGWDGIGGNPAAATFINGANTCSPPQTAVLWVGTVSMGANCIPIMAFDGEKSDNKNLQKITESMMSSLLLLAIDTWGDTNIKFKERLQDVQVQMIDLPDGMLGMMVGEKIYLDKSGAGYGWYTLHQNDHFQKSGSYFKAIPGTTAADLIDLYTVILHELGHILGYGHEDHGLMNHQLKTGVRKIPKQLRNLEYEMECQH